MTPTLRRKLEALAERREEIERLLADPATVNDAARYRGLMRECSQLEPIAAGLVAERHARADLAAAEAMRSDPELAELAEEEIDAALGVLASLARYPVQGIVLNPGLGPSRCRISGAKPAAPRDSLEIDTGPVNENELGDGGLYR